MPKPVRSLLLLLLLFLGAAIARPADARNINVELTGVEGDAQVNVLAYLDLVRFAERPDLSAAAVRRLYDRAPGQIREALKPFGYYDARIVSRNLSRLNDVWTATFDIDIGEPVRLTEVRVEVTGEGRDHRSFRNIVEDVPLAVGAPVRHAQFDQLRGRLERAAATHGYFDRRFTERRLEVDPAARTARAVLVMDTGPRYSFGKVSIDQDILRDQLIERMIFTREGEPFDNDRLLRTQYALSDSHYFSNVIVETGDRDLQTLTVPVEIDTIAARSQRIRLGLGYGTDTEVRGSVSWDWRRLNDRGHHANLMLQVSQPITELMAQYVIPVGDPLRERFAVRSTLVEQEFADIDSRRATLGISYRRVLGSWQRNIFTDVIHERTELAGAPSFSDTSIVPGINFDQLIADDPLAPARGHRLRAEVRGSTGFLLAGADFLRVHLQAAMVRAPSDDWRYQLRGELGAGLAGGFGDLPASQRFFAGGDQSVRGYGYNALGSRDAEGRIVGGRHLMFGSAEIHRRVRGPWFIAAFTDVGNAIEEFGDSVEVSAGLGVHYLSPIGRIRVEVAQPLTENRSPRLHISIRPDL
jgi:translocation and assembly module TamA